MHQRNFSGAKLDVAVHRLSEARGVTWRLEDASPHEDASLSVLAFESELTSAQCSSFSVSL